MFARRGRSSLGVDSDRSSRRSSSTGDAISTAAAADDGGAVGRCALRRRSMRALSERFHRRDLAAFDAGEYDICKDLMHMVRVMTWHE